jgi:hypothetical protein
MHREPPPSPRTLPRPGPRPHLSLLLCPEFDPLPAAAPCGGYSSPRSPSSSPALGRRFLPSGSLPRPHALARARGAELLACSSLPCSPTLTRLGRREREVARELSLPASSLPRIHIVHCDQVREGCRPLLQTPSVGNVEFEIHQL